MIIVKLMGGLGNQMFQYAAARRLASVHSTCVKLDLTFLLSEHPGVIKRNYELCHLNISAEIASPLELAEFSEKRPGPLESVWSTFLRKFRLASSLPRVYREPHFHFDPGLLTAPDNIYLDGYWQSEKYFADIAQIIRAEFAVKAPLERKNLEMAEQIKATSSVSLHVRRGDYVTNPETMRVHGVCGLDYYRKCVAEVDKRVPEPHFFVFSDEPEWVKENLMLDYPVTFVTHNGPEKGCEDLRLMSLCKHNVIANSSFSWWGAWLNPNPDKIVCAPMNWLSDTSHNTADILPAAWLKF